MKSMLLLAGWLLAWSTYAQNTLDKSPMPVVAAGLQSAMQGFRNSYTGGFESKGGLHLAAGLEKPLTHRLTISGLLGYSQLGSRNTAYSGHSEHLDYATFTLRATEYVPVGGSDIYLSLGSQLGYGINGRRENNSGTVVAEKLFDRPEYNKWDWGLWGGLGLKLPWGTFLEGGWYWALVHCNNTFGAAYNNSAFQLTLGQTVGWSRYKSFVNRR